MATPASWNRRLHELAESLAGRARRCPGLYPFTTPGPFLLLAGHGTGTPARVAAGRLEEWQRHPASLADALRHRQDLATAAAATFAPRVVTTTAAEETRLEQARRKRLLGTRHPSRRQAA